MRYLRFKPGVFETSEAGYVLETSDGRLTDRGPCIIFVYLKSTGTLLCHGVSEKKLRQWISDAQRVLRKTGFEKEADDLALLHVTDLGWPLEKINRCLASTERLLHRSIAREEMGKAKKYQFKRMPFRQMLGKSLILSVGVPDEAARALIDNTLEYYLLVALCPVSGDAAPGTALHFWREVVEYVDAQFAKDFSESLSTAQQIRVSLGELLLFDMSHIQWGDPVAKGGCNALIATAISFLIFPREMHRAAPEEIMQNMRRRFGDTPRLHRVILPHVMTLDQLPTEEWLVRALGQALDLLQREHKEDDVQ